MMSIKWEKNIDVSNYRYENGGKMVTRAPWIPYTLPIKRTIRTIRIVI